MRITGPAVIFLFLALSACNDGEPVAPVDPLELVGSGANMIQPISEAAPPGVPPEFEAPTVLHSVEPDAGWRYGKAYAGAIVRYSATHGYVRATVTAGGTSHSLEAQQSQFLPLYSEIAAPEPEIPMPTCTGSIRGDAFGRVWNEYVSFATVLRWGEQMGSGTKFFECPAPPSTSPPSGGSDDRTCITVEIEYYLYDPNTGTVEYLYTKTYTRCTKPGQYAT